MPSSTTTTSRSEGALDHEPLVWPIYQDASRSSPSSNNFTKRMKRRRPSSCPSNTALDSLRAFAMGRTINNVFLFLVVLMAVACSSSSPVFVEGATHKEEQYQQQPKNKRIRKHRVPARMLKGRGSSGVQQRNYYNGGRSSKTSGVQVRTYGGVQQRHFDYGGKGKGKGMGGGSFSASRRFLPPRIEPIPFVNCIPVPPGGSFPGGRSSKSKGKGKGKGGKGKGGKGHNRRADRLHMGAVFQRQRGLRRRRSGGKGAGQQRGLPPPLRMMRLPYCPIDVPTFFPTILPTFTPLPSITPYPSFTPFPSLTPFPTEDEGPQRRPTPRPTRASLRPTRPPTTPTISTMPSVSKAPSGAPSVPTTGAPTPTTATVDILVDSTFSLIYFTDMATDVVRDLTTAEYAELRTLMNEFYTTEFQADPAFSTDFQNYDTVFRTMTYDPAGNPHIFIEFDANFMFAPGSSVTAVDVFNKMDGLNYQTFITDYLMRNPPLNQLDQVMFVGFTGSVGPTVTA